MHTNTLIAEDSATAAASPARRRTSLAARLRFYLASVACGCALALIVGLLALWHFGSFRGIVAASRGDSFLVATTEADLGEMIPGSQKQADFTVRNLSMRTIRVVGAQTSCSCVSPQNLPIAIPSGQQRTVALGVTMRGPNLGQTVYLLIDDGAVQPQSVTIYARAPASDSAGVTGDSGTTKASGEKH